MLECREALAAAEFDDELRTDAEAEDTLAGLHALPATTRSSVEPSWTALPVLTPSRTKRPAPGETHGWRSIDKY